MEQRDAPPQKFTAVIQYWLNKCQCGGNRVVVRSGDPPSVRIMCIGCNAATSVKRLARKYRVALPLIPGADKDVDNARLDFLNDAGPNLGHSQMIRRITIEGRPFCEAVFEVFKEVEG